MKLEFNDLRAYMHAVKFCIENGLQFRGEDTPDAYVLHFTGGF